MNQKWHQEELDAEFLTNRAKRMEEEERKTAKKRLKRLIDLGFKTFKLVHQYRSNFQLWNSLRLFVNRDVLLK